MGWVHANGSNNANSQAMTEFLDFTNFTRPSSKNHYLVAPEGLCQNATPDAAAPVFPMELPALYANLVAQIENTPGFVDLVQDAENCRLRFIAKTKLLKFKDDIDVSVLSAPGGATLAIYSRSRVGYGDFGANKKRVEGMLKALYEELTMAEGRIAGGSNPRP